MIAKGHFDVQLTQQKHDTVDAGRMVISKQYEGDLVGEGRGQMLSKRTNTEGSAGYVALEDFTGSLSGVSGSFTLQHTGIMNRGEQSLDIIIVPDSGIEGFKGIAGKMQIDNADGKHHYQLEYSFD